MKRVLLTILLFVRCASSEGTASVAIKSWEPEQFDYCCEKDMRGCYQLVQKPLPLCFADETNSILLMASLEAGEENKLYTYKTMRLTTSNKEEWHDRARRYRYIRYHGDYENMITVYLSINPENLYVGNFYFNHHKNPHHMLIFNGEAKITVFKYTGNKLEKFKEYVNSLKNIKNIQLADSAENIRMFESYIK
jgi:hypothetical protein